MKAAFQTLRQNARRRKKVFTLSWERFKELCYETNYIAGRGRKSKSFTIDRERNNEGYTDDNVRVIAKGDNSRKKDKVLVYDYRHPELTTVT